MSRSGDWIATFSGQKWFISDPDPADVRIEDIAHALSLICRFGGHCREFYSVAQHSVHVADVIAIDQPDDYHLQLWGLMHDATEAYVGDMVRPLKLTLPQYKVAENLTEWAICEGLGILVRSDIQMAVKFYDDVMLMTERRDLVNHCGHEWTPRARPWERTLVAWDSALARSNFMFRYNFLTSKLGMKTGGKP